MRIGCLQFAPHLGDVDQNLNRADAVLSRACPKDLDLLVLPELAFSGYNFKSLKHISPYLEPTAAGISSLWARTTALKYDCVVTVGYPEKVDISPKWPTSPEYYSSSITVNKEGETIANYRKSFLYYTDETWALEGPDGFYDGEIEDLGNVAMGICMDLNPYKFEAPWSAWEFAYHILHRQANLAVISMAWLTREDARAYSRSPKEPDMETLAYWVARLEPLIRNEGEKEIIVVFANRSGVEDDAVYAGTSAVLGIQSGEVKLYGVLGRGERELLVVDTSKRPQAKLVHDAATHAQMPSSENDNSKTANGTNGTNGTKSKTSSSTTATAGSTPIRGSFDDPEDPIGSIGEMLATTKPLSPVEPRSNHIFFGKEPTKDAERMPLKSTTVIRQDVPVKLQDLAADSVSEPLSPGSPQRVPITSSTERDLGLISSNETANRPMKSSFHGVPKRTTTPGPESGPNGVYERPSSPKSRNASRNRQPHAPQEQALYTHDLAGMEPERKSLSRTHSRNHSRQGFHRNISPDMMRNVMRNGNGSGHSETTPPHSADEIKLPPGIEIVRDDNADDDENYELDTSGSPPRPRSTGW